MSEQHPLIRALMSKPIKSVVEKRAINTLIRRILLAQRLRSGEIKRRYGQDTPYVWEQVVDLSYDQFLQELSKPDGGIVGALRGMGDASISILRKRCLHTVVGYGYA